MRNLLILFLFIFSLSSLALASPMASIPERDIEGTIASLSWNPEFTAKGMFGMSGSLGGDRTFKASYDVTLIDCVVNYSEKDLTPEELSMYQPVATGSINKMHLTLEHEKDDDFLKPGMKIKVEGYDKSGDEGGVWTRFRKIEILNQNSCNPTEGCGSCPSKK